MPLTEEFIIYSFQEEGVGYATQGHRRKHQHQSRDRSKGEAVVRAFLTIVLGSY